MLTTNPKETNLIHEFADELNGKTFQEALALTETTIADLAQVERYSCMRYMKTPNSHKIELWERSRNRLLDYMDFKTFLSGCDPQEKLDSSLICVYERGNH